MILERVYNLAVPRLREKKIRDVRIGLGLMAIELDDGSIGITYVLRKEMEHICTALSQAGGLVGMPAEEIARWVLQGENVITVAMGLAVLNSVADFTKLGQENDACQDADAVFSTEIQATDTIGIVGQIGPLILNLKNKVQRLIVFERGENASGQIYPETAQPELLPECRVVFISSTSLINGTMENLLNYCTKARDVVMVGSSTPLYPEAFRGTGVTILSGTRWLSANREAILAGISQCAGMRQLIKYGQKVSVRIMS